MVKTIPTTRVPYSIIFFSNGLAAVCDEEGEQIPEYQAGIHPEVVEYLSRCGYDYRTLRVSGCPQNPPYCDRDGKVIPEEYYVNRRLPPNA